MAMLKVVVGTLAKYADAVAALQNLVTAIAVVMAAFWFVRRRLRFPRARVEHAITAVDLDQHGVLLRIQARIENVGDVLMRLKTVCLYIQQIRPLDSSITQQLLAGGDDPVPQGKCELPWPGLVTRDYDWRDRPYEIEPGEVETCHFDAIVARDVETVQVYTHVENRVKWFKKIGWNTTSIYDINFEAAAAAAEASITARTKVSTAASEERLGQTTVADEVKKQAPVRERPPITQGPKKEPVTTPPPRKK